MRLSVLLTLVACAGSPPAEPTPRAPAPAPRAQPVSSRALAGYPPPAEPGSVACVVTGGWGPDQPHELRFRRGGRTFATLHKVKRATLSLGEDPASPFVDLTSDDARLWGYVVADQLLIHPSAPILLAGYLAPGPTAELRWLGARSEPAAVEVKVPDFVKPVAPPREQVRCRDLAIDERDFDPREAFGAAEGDSIMLAERTAIPISQTPNGPPVAELRFESAGSPLIDVVERKGDRARIVIGHSSLNPAENVLVVGWVAAAALRPHSHGFGGSWGSAGDGSSPLGRRREGWRMVACAHDVPIVVEVESERHLVGAIRKGVTLEVPPEADKAGDQLVEIAERSRELELADDTRLLAKGSSLANCSEPVAPEVVR